MTKSQILLLHGALGAARQFRNLAELLADDFEVHTLDFEGHGKREDANRPFRMEHFADNVRDYLNEHAVNQPLVFGYSMGGYVALYLESQQPDIFKGIMTLGTKWEWSPEIAAKETAMLNTDKIETKVPDFAKALEQRHSSSDWKTVCNKTKDLLEHLGEENVIDQVNLKDVKIPVNICIGDQDNMVTREETEAMAERLPNGAYKLLPYTKHPFERVNPEVLVNELRQTI